MAELGLYNFVKNVFAISLLLPALASAAALNRPHSNTGGLMSVTNHNVCTDDPSWVGAVRTDCVGAIQQLYDVEVKHYKDRDLTFQSPNQPEKRGAMVTPLRYTHGTCTLAIVMMNFWDDKQLPGNEDLYHAPRDITSWRDIWEAASQIEAVCLQHSGKQGWAAEGGREAIGIFIWATDSPADQLVPQSMDHLGAASSAMNATLSGTSVRPGSIKPPVDTA